MSSSIQPIEEHTDTQQLTHWLHGDHTRVIKTIVQLIKEVNELKIKLGIKETSISDMIEPDNTEDYEQIQSLSVSEEKPKIRGWFS